MLATVLNQTPRNSRFGGVCDKADAQINTESKTADKRWRIFIIRIPLANNVNDGSSINIRLSPLNYDRGTRLLESDASARYFARRQTPLCGWSVSYFMSSILLFSRTPFEVSE